jgi:hypothetical protein
MANYDTSFYDSGEFYDAMPAPAAERYPMSKVKLNLKELTPDELVSFANQIVTAMTGNANFTTPNPTLASITTLKNTAATKVAAQKAAVQAALQATNDRDAALLALSDALVNLASYVQNTSGGNGVVIQSAGMSVKALAVPIGPLGQVQNLTITAGDDEGELDLAWDPIRGAKSYQVQTSPDPITPTSWKDVAPAGKSKKSLSGLESGERTWVRVRAIAPKEENNGAWSDPAVKTVP